MNFISKNEHSAENHAKSIPQKLKRKKELNPYSKNFYGGSMSLSYYPLMKS